MTFKHIPVMLEDVMTWMPIKPDGVYADGTLGGGGHSGEILKRSGGTATLYGIDRDAVRASVLRANPYLADVRLERHLPDTVTLICTSREGAYYMEINGEWVVLTQDLVVLECGCTPVDC